MHFPWQGNMPVGVKQALILQKLYLHSHIDFVHGIDSIDGGV